MWILERMKPGFILSSFFSSMPVMKDSEAWCNGIYKLIFGHSFSFDGGLWLTKSKSTAACPTIHIFDKEIWWCLNCTVFPWELGQFCLIWNNANFPESLDLQKKRPRKTCIIIKLFSWSYVFIWATKIHQNIFYLWTTSWRKETNI